MLGIYGKKVRRADEKENEANGDCKQVEGEGEEVDEGQELQERHNIELKEIVGTREKCYRDN